MNMIRFRLKQMIAEKEFQLGRHLTIKEVSERTGINRITLSKILNQPGHSTTTENIDRLCQYFECPVEKIMTHIPINEEIKNGIVE